MGSKQFRYDALAAIPMASGHLGLNLSETVTWEEFPEYAKAVLNAIGGTRAHIADAPDIRLWDVVIEGQAFQLVFDDFPTMVSLESADVAGDAILRQIHARLASS